MLAIARTIHMVSRQHLIRITAGHRTTPSLVINEGRQRAIKGQDIRHAGMAKTGPRGRRVTGHSHIRGLYGAFLASHELRHLFLSC